jgi:hypothetical protein
LTVAGEEVPSTPTTKAVKVVVPPRVGVVGVKIVTVGIKLDTLKVTVFETAAK